MDIVFLGYIQHQDNIINSDYLQVLSEVGPAVLISTLTNIFADAMGTFTSSPEITLLCLGNLVMKIFQIFGHHNFSQISGFHDGCLLLSGSSLYLLFIFNFLNLISDYILRRTDVSCWPLRDSYGEKRTAEAPRKSSLSVWQRNGQREVPTNCNNSFSPQFTINLCN